MRMPRQMSMNPCQAEVCHLWHAAAQDLTWGLFAGVDTVEYTNKPTPDTRDFLFLASLLKVYLRRFYDLYKARDLGKVRC